MGKLHIENISPAKTLIIENTPSSGDQTIYQAFSDPKVTGDSLTRTVIRKIEVLSSGEITETYANTSDGQLDPLEFNKIWSNRENYFYHILNF